MRKRFMVDSRPLYNSRNIKVWIEYLQRYHPEANLNAILTHSAIGMDEVEDQGHWFTQVQIDRFYESARQQTGDPEIARKAGRYIASCGGLGYFNQFAQGFLTTQTAYRLVAKIAGFFSKGAALTMRRIGPHQAEVISVPHPGIQEKPYQCENRTGLLEAIPQFFTGNLAKIEHPECWHHGDSQCRYLISWDRTASAVWKRVRNIIFVTGVGASLAILFFLPLPQWIFATSIIAIGVMGVWICQLYQSNLQLIRSVQTQSNQSSDYMDEMSMLYNDAVLIQEIGQAIANIRQKENLISAVTQAMEKSLSFDRGMIMLAIENRSKLLFVSGYGYGEDLEEFVRKTEFNLDKPGSKGFFVKAFHEQKPFLIRDLNALFEKLSTRSSRFADTVGANALVCVPIVYEKESIGILAVDNIHSKRPLRKSDISLLSGISSHIAVGLANARAFQKLTESGKNYRNLVENVNSIILRRDPGGSITFFNEFAQRLFGYREDEIVGKNFFSTILSDSTEIRKEFDALTETLMAHPETHIVKETKSLLQTGETVWIAWTHKPIIDSSGDNLEILCIGTDITQLKRAQNEKKELEARPAHSQKMESIGTLAGGIAHDFNNILSSVIGFTELSLGEVEKGTHIADNLQEVYTAGKRAKDLVRQILAFARQSEEELKPIYVDTIATKVLKFIRASIPATIEIKQNIESDSLIMGNATQVHQILMNLFTNAAHAMEDNGGVLEFSLKDVTMDCDVTQKKLGLKPGNYIEMKVLDTGTGIAPEIIDSIFDPYFTTKGPGEGTGMGLAMVYGIIESYGGKISVDSKPGQGTLFTIYLPVSRKPQEHGSYQSEELPAGAERILFVDDEAPIAKLGGQVLEGLGYTVSIRTSSIEALELFRTKPDAFDLVITDTTMPNMTGDSLANELMKIRPDIPVILCTGYSKKISEESAFEMGIKAFIYKPIVKADLSKITRKVLDDAKGTV